MFLLDQKSRPQVNMFYQLKYILWDKFVWVAFDYHEFTQPLEWWLFVGSLL